MAGVSSKHRTNLQIEANKLDLEIFNLVRKMDRFVEISSDTTVRRDARAIHAMRGSVRAYMHKEDRGKTIG